MPGTGLAYGQAGGWGNLELPLQFFITVARPPTPGVSMLAGLRNAKWRLLWGGDQLCGPLSAAWKCDGPRHPINTMRPAACECSCLAAD